MSQFGPRVWAVGGGVLAILSTAHLLFRAIVYMEAAVVKAVEVEAAEVVGLN